MPKRLKMVYEYHVYLICIHSVTQTDFLISEKTAPLLKSNNTMIALQKYCLNYYRNKQFSYRGYNWRTGGSGTFHPDRFAPAVSLSLFRPCRFAPAVSAPRGFAPGHFISICTYIHEIGTYAVPVINDM